MRKNKIYQQENKKIDNNSSVNSSDIKLINQFAATINHKINNPLTTIIGQAEISEIAHQIGSEKLLKKALKNIINEAQKIRTITKKLENLDHIKSEDYAGYAKIFDLN